MHELQITQSVLDIVLRKSQEAQASKVTRINLVIGELAGFAPNCIEFYFDSLSKDTIAEGAVLDFQSIPVQLRCRVCSTTFDPRDTEWVCPGCHSQSIEIVGGKELYINSMEVE